MKKLKISNFIIAPLVVISILLTIIFPFSNKNDKIDEDEPANHVNASTGASSAALKDKGGTVYLAEGASYTMSSGTTIDGKDAEYGGAFYVDDGATLTINGGTISGCSAGYGGAIYVQSGGTLKINGAANITDCSADSGGAVYVESGATLTISGAAKIKSCSADNGGGIYVESGARILLNNTSILSCSASNRGGAVYVEGYCKIDGLEMASNNICSAKEGGAFFIADGGSVEMTSGTITGSATGYGGAFLVSNSGNLSISGGKVTNSSASAGGAIYIATDGKCTLTGSPSFSGNTAKSGGNAIYAEPLGSLLMNIGVNCINRADISSRNILYSMAKIGISITWAEVVSFGTYNGKQIWWYIVNKTSTGMSLISAETVYCPDYAEANSMLSRFMVNCYNASDRALFKNNIKPVTLDMFTTYNTYFPDASSCLASSLDGRGMELESGAKTSFGNLISCYWLNYDGLILFPDGNIFNPIVGEELFYDSASVRMYAEVSFTDDNVYYLDGDLFGGGSSFS